MGKKLTYFERAQREREKERERVKRADAVARRRSEAKRIREREEKARTELREQQRNAERRAKEREEIRIKIQKEEELEEKIRNAKKEVETYETFISNITNLHLSSSISNYNIFHNAFKNGSKFDNSIVKEPTQPKSVSLYNFKANNFSFEEKKFHFDNEKQLKQSKERVNYTPEEYCKLMNKYKPSVFGWILYFILLFPFAFLHFLIAKKNFYTDSNYNNFISFETSEMYRLESEKEEARILFEKLQNEKKQKAFEKFEIDEKERKIKEHEEYEKNLKNYTILLEKYKKDLIIYNAELEEKKKTHEQNELLKAKWYNNLLNGEKEAVEEMLELIFPITFNLNEEFIDSDPTEIEVGFNVVNKNSIDVSISLDKEMKYIPEVAYKLTASGKEASEYALSQKAKNEKTNAFICSLTLAYIKSVFEYCSSIENLRLEISVPSTNKKTGEYEDEILISLTADRKTYNKIIYTNIDPTEAINNFDNEYKPIENQKISISSKLDNDNLIWATKEDTGVAINAIIKRAFKKLN